MKSPETFGAPWGSAMKVVTPAVTVLLGFALWTTAMTARPAPLRWGVEVVVGLVLAVCPLFQVRGYELGGGVLSIRRPGWRHRIPLAGLRSLETDGRPMSACLRLCGNGGFWSITGLYWNRRLGRFRAFVNDPSRAIALRFEKKCVVVSPDDQERFVRRVREEAGLA